MLNIVRSWRTRLPSSFSARAAIIILLFATCFRVFSRTVSDPDLWGHLRFGLDFLQTGWLARTDPYSFTAFGLPWINHEWLSEVAFAFLWRSAGSPGLIVFKLCIGLAIATVAYLWLTHRGVRAATAAILLLVALWPIADGLAHVRPQMFTYLLFELLLLILICAEEGFYRWLWATPFIFALWSNLHGGFLAGLGVYAVWATFHVITHHSRARRVIWPFVASLVATCANPYGPALPLFLLRTATIPRPEIVDWQPVQIVSPPGVVYIAILSVFTAGLFLSRRPHPISLMLVYGICALLPLLAVRHLAFFALAALAIAGEHAAAAWERRTPNRTKAELGSRFGLLSVPIAFVLLGLSISQLAGIPLVQTYPVQAVKLIQDAGIGGNLAVTFGWGEYTIWHLGPRVRVSLDGRRETVYPEKIYMEDLAFEFGVGSWDAILNHYPVDMVLVAPGSPPANLMRLYPGWRVVYADGSAILFARANSQLAALLENAQRPDNVSSYFP